jgi:hypothetical protein
MRRNLSSSDSFPKISARLYALAKKLHLIRASQGGIFEWKEQLLTGRSSIACYMLAERRWR